MKKVKKMPKVKPCPAGHKAAPGRYKIQHLGNTQEYVNCSKCDCHWSFDGLFTTRREAILAWNKRA